VASILETIQTTISNNIRNDNAIFVFSTDIACTTWAEWAVKNSGVRAVPRERFKAWDRFKAESTDEKSSGHPVPGLLRKVFVENLMTENASNPVFKKIISPEFAADSSSFTDWVSTILPSLKSWHDRYEKIYGNQVQDTEDEDYELLYKRYSDFLLKDPVTGLERKEKLYEPAWETKNLLVDGKEYYVFFPEILDDYADYKDFFESGDIPNLHVFFVKDTDDINKEVSADYFSNSRTEFKKLCLELRHVHETEKISWREMAVSLPDIDTYLPYIERDLKLYAIPYVVRSGRKVTGINAGSIFTCVKNVYESDFSYDSMRALLTNSFVPWKHENLNEELIREGAARKCIINYEKNGKPVDVWAESLQYVQFKQVSEWYADIKKWVKDFYSAKDFKSVQQTWFAFRDKIFDFDSLEQESECNLVLGHCLDKLVEMIELEEQYGIKVSNPFSFFITELDNSVYQPQQKHAGVNIFKYKVSATAAFKYQYVVDANQSNLSVMNTQLRFLNNEKRAALKITDEDAATESFIVLYGKNQGCFSCSQSTVNGFAIPHSRLTTSKDPVDLIREELQVYDLPSKEQIFLRSEAKAEKPDAVYELQTSGDKGFLYYEKINRKVSEEEIISEPLRKLIEKEAYAEGKVKVNASALSSYFPCPRKWLFSYILDLSEDSLTAELFNVFDVGNIYHRVLEKFFGYYYQNKKPIPLVNEKGELPEKEKILKQIAGYLKEVYEETDDRKALSFNRMKTKSPLLKEVMESQIEQAAGFFIPVLESLCAPYDEKHTKASGFGNAYVAATEGKFSDNENENYSLYGEIDGVFDDNDRLSIIDYKTSKTKGPADCIINEEEYNPDSEVLPELKDFQLPMYVHLLQKSKLAKAGDLEQALFFSLKKREKNYIVKQPQKTKQNTKYVHDKTVTAEQFETTLEVFRRYAECFASEIRACKSFEPDFSKVKDYEHCAGCSYKSICRTTYIKRDK